jgi:hypothetical protein
MDTVHHLKGIFFFPREINATCMRFYIDEKEKKKKKELSEFEII